MGKAGKPTLALPHARSASRFIPKSRTRTFRLRIQGNPDGLIFIYMSSSIEYMFYNHRRQCHLDVSVHVAVI